MAEPIMRGAEYLRCRQRILAAEMELGAALDHRGLKGAWREDCVRRALSELLPPDIAFGHGQILSTTGEQSPEIDVIVYDARIGPGLFRLGNITAFPAECVLAAISVKTRLELSHIEEMSNLAVMLRDFDRFPRHGHRGAGDGGGGKANWPNDADPPPGVSLRVREHL